MREGTRKEKIRDGKSKGKKAEPVRKKEAQKDKARQARKKREKERINKRFVKREAEHQEIKRAKTACDIQTNVILHVAI